MHSLDHHVAEWTLVVEGKEPTPGRGTNARLSADIAPGWKSGGTQRWSRISMLTFASAPDLRFAVDRNARGTPIAARIVRIGQCGRALRTGSTAAARGKRSESGLNARRRSSPRAVHQLSCADKAARDDRRKREFSGGFRGQLNLHLRVRAA